MSTRCRLARRARYTGSSLCPALLQLALAILVRIRSSPGHQSPRCAIPITQGHPACAMKPRGAPIDDLPEALLWQIIALLDWEDGLSRRRRAAAAAYAGAAAALHPAAVTDGKMLATLRVPSFPAAGERRPGLPPLAPAAVFGAGNVALSGHHLQVPGRGPARGAGAVFCLQARPAEPRGRPGAAP